MRMSPTSPLTMNKPRWRASALAAVLLLALVSPAAPKASAHVRGHHQHSAASVLGWNETASAAYTASKFSPPVFAVGMAYVQAAVYNAVVGIEGRFRPVQVGCACTPRNVGGRGGSGRCAPHASDVRA